MRNLTFKVFDYSPILAGCFGGKKVDWIDMEKAMKGFILHRTLFPDEARHKEDTVLQRHPYGYGNRFPNMVLTSGFSSMYSILKPHHAISSPYYLPIVMMC